MESEANGYCYVCGGWLELNREKMCDECYESWRVAYRLTPAAMLARCDIS